MPKAKPKRGQGMVRFRAGKYQATVQISGQRFWQTFDRERDAWAWIGALKADGVRGILKVKEGPRDVRFDDLCRAYKVQKIPRWRPGTAAFYDCHVKGVLLPAFGRRMISTIRSQEIQTFLDRKLESVSGSTVNKYHQVLTAVYGFAVRMGHIEQSPMVAVERARAKSKVTRVLRLYELQAFFRACLPEDLPFFTILFFCGLRRSEIFRMRWDDWVDLGRELLHVRVAKVGSSDIPMAEPVKKAFLDLGGPQTGLVFPGHRRGRKAGEPADREKQLTARRRTLFSTLKRAGIEAEGISLHSYRHTFITLLEEDGLPYSVVRALARHGQRPGDMTARYLHPTEEQLRAALAMLTKKVLGPLNIIPLRIPA